MNPTARITFAFAALLALSGVFGFWVGGSVASLSSGLLLASLVAGFALAGQRGWSYAWPGSLVLAGAFTAYLAISGASPGSIVAAALAIAGLVTAAALRAPSPPAKAS